MSGPGPLLAAAARLRSRPAAPVSTDLFDRADSSSDLGSTEGGSAGPLLWTPTPGATWGVAAGRARLVSASGGGTDQWALVDTGVSDGTVAVDVTTPGSTPVLAGVAVRCSDTTWVGWLARLNTFASSNALELFRRTGRDSLSLEGSWSPAGITTATTYRLAVVLDGPSIRCLLDGEERIAVTDSAGQTATRHGLSGHSLSSTTLAARWDDWTVTP